MFTFSVGLIIAFTVAFASVSLAAVATPGMEFVGRGVQIYTCEQSGANFKWVLKGPNALLYDAKGKVVAGIVLDRSDRPMMEAKPKVSSF